MLAAASELLRKVSGADKVAALNTSQQRLLLTWKPLLLGLTMDLHPQCISAYLDWARRMRMLN